MGDPFGKTRHWGFDLREPARGGQFLAREGLVRPENAHPARAVGAGNQERGVDQFIDAIEDGHLVDHRLFFVEGAREHAQAV
ncbi:MAG: hypothetical protein GDA40_05495 [Rhodobacteraceae bacterium]|nr:hypothetical protein [Paracoccaceae bacterium]